MARLSSIRGQRAFIVVIVSTLLVGGVWWLGTLAHFHWKMDVARTALADGRADDAVKLLEELQRRHTGDGAATYLLAVAYRRAGDFRRAETYLRRAQGLGWPELEVQQQKTLLAAQLGDVRQAEALLPALLQQGASDETAEEFYEAVSEGYVRTYRLREAWKSLVFWSDWRPAAPQPKLLKAAICERVGDLPGAVVEYRELLQTHPRHVAGRVRYARALLEQNEVAQALEQFEFLGAEAPDTVEVWLGWGACLRRLGRSDEARAKFQRLETLELPADKRSVTQAELGELELTVGEYDKALQRLRDAVQRDPRDHRLQYALARAYQLTNQPEQAEKHRQIHAELRRKSDRLHEVTRQLIDKPTDTELRYEAALLLREQGFETDARGWLRSILQIDPGHEPARRALNLDPP